MDVKPGYKTTEFWMTAIGSVLAALMPILVLYGVLDNEEATMWSGLVLAIAAVVIPIVVVSAAKNYNDNRTAVKIESMERSG